jgi:hypothetical protein
VRIAESGSQLLLPSLGPGEEVALKPANADESLADARDLLLLGQTYATEVEGHTAAARWTGLIQKAFARVNLGADFGYRAATSVVTTAGLEMLQEQTGHRVLNDVHGIMVFECEPRPRFVRATVSPVNGVQAERLITAVYAAIKSRAVMSERDQLAYDLFSASCFSESADARLAMLMMALETLIEPQLRSEATREHVDHLIEETRGSRLPENEVDSITASLRWLRTESIGQAGRKLALRVGNRSYMDEPPERFFTNCYALRSQLIHGHYPRPEWAEVNGRAGALELLVRDLLSIEILDALPD